jgi:hypothetical protein
MEITIVVEDGESFESVRIFLLKCQEQGKSPQEFIEALKEEFGAEVVSNRQLH